MIFRSAPSLMGIFRAIKRSCLLLAFVSVFLTTSWAQDACLQPTCGQLSVEVIRQDANVSTDCSGGSIASCGTHFRQMFYKVYVKYNDPTGSTTQFDLDYQMLNLKVNLLNLLGNAPQHSYIDAVATTSCYTASTNGSNWSSYTAPTQNGQADAVKFSADDQSVSINFFNFNGTGCGSTGTSGNNIIPFTYTTPANAGSCSGFHHTCAYVELFTIVVNAWPGEQIQFALDSEGNNKLYISHSGGTSCTLTADNTGNNNSIYNNGPTILGPTGFSSTENQYLQLAISGPTGTNPHDFEVKLNNSTSHSFTINDMDFFVKVVMSAGYDEVLTYSGTSPHEVLDGGVDGFGNTTKYLHYVVSGSVGSMGSLSIGHIQFSEPTISNMGWRVSLELQAGRLSTTYTSSGHDITVCTGLNVYIPTPAIGYSSANITFCTSSDIHFQVISAATSACNQDYVYEAGLTYASGTATKFVTRLAFTLEFDMDPDVSISSTIDLTNWGTSAVCASPEACFGSSCYQVTGNKFEYCFLATDATPETFNIGAFSYLKINFPHTSNGCIRGVKITRLEIRYRGESTSCIPPIANTIDPATHLIKEAACGPNLYGYIRTELSHGVDEVTADAVPRLTADCGGSLYAGGCTSSTNLSAATGLYGFCDLCTSISPIKFKVTPSKNNNWLNGVSTFDLVLITQHILGTGALGSPYKMIAADANRNGSITTFDVVELRKLILGIYSTGLPSNTSWRFILSSFVFTDPTDPFLDPLDNYAYIDCVAPASNHDFIGIKIGDVNDNVMARPTQRSSVSVSLNKTYSRQSRTIVVPVTYTGSKTLKAIQLGIHFDPTKLALINTSEGDLPEFTTDNFGLTRVDSGEIRSLWFSMQDEFAEIKTGAVLFNLTFKVLDNFFDSEPLLYFDDNILENTAWQTNGTEYSIMSSSSVQERKEPGSSIQESLLQVIVQPNPATGTATFSIWGDKAMQGSIILFNTFGDRIFVREVHIEAGQQSIHVPEITDLPAGVYFWKVTGEDEQAQGRLLKQ